MPDETMEALLKTMHNSLAVRFGTTAPYSISSVIAEKIGFAQIPCVVTHCYCHERDLDALVPIVRQRVYTELASRGWGPDDIAFQPTVQHNRRRRFVDDNESSESYGKNKVGIQYRFTFEMNRDLRLATFALGSRWFAELPTKEAVDA